MNIGKKTEVFSCFDPLMYASFLMLIAAIVSNLTSYQLIDLFGFEVSLGTFTMPLILMLLNPIAEVYGKEKSSRILVAVCIMEILFSVLFSLFSSFEGICDSTNIVNTAQTCKMTTSAYQLISSNIVRGAISFSVGGAIGSYLNMKFLLHLKNLWSSERYFVRVIFSSMVGEISYTLVCFFLAFYGVFSIRIIANILISSLFLKLIATFILSYASRFLVIVFSRHKKWLSGELPVRRVRFSSRDIQYEKN